MTRIVAGVFGFGSEAAEVAVRDSLGPDASTESAGPITLGWTGGARASGPQTLLLAGRVQNVASLAAELGASLELGAEAILAHGYGRWGKDLLARLRGCYSLVVWDPAAKTGFLAVDQLGAGGLFLHGSEGRLAFATELRDLVRLLSSRPAPSPRGVVQWIVDGYLAPGDTLFEGIRRLEGGHAVGLEDGLWRSSRYWSPRYVSPTRLTTAEAAVGIEVELTRSVRERLAETGATGVLLSGGLDSSAVAAIACRLEPRVRLQAYSLVDPERLEMDESAVIERVTLALDIPWEPMPMPRTGTLPAALEFQLAWELPAATPMLGFTMPLLRRAAQDGMTVMLDGEGGDELFGYSPYLIADCLRRGNLARAIALARAVPGMREGRSRRDVWAQLSEHGLKGAAPHALHRTLRRVAGARYAPPWLTPASSTIYLEARDAWAWKQREGPRWWAFLADLLVSWREQMGAHDFLRQRAVLAGVENRHPLLDDLGLVELVLRLPPHLSFDASFTRPLLRSATAGVVPKEIQHRTDKADFSRLLIDALCGPDYEIALDLLAAPDAEIRGYTRPELVRDILETPNHQRGLEWARLTWRLATTEAWLRSQEAPDFPRRVLGRHARSFSGDRVSARAPRRDATS